jgi:hypothetical protein
LTACPAARNFSAGQGDLAQKYFVYFKAKQRGSAEKDPPFGYVGNFQTSPSHFAGNFLSCPRIYGNYTISNRKTQFHLIFFLGGCIIALI